MSFYSNVMPKRFGAGKPRAAQLAQLDERIARVEKHMGLRAYVEELAVSRGDAVPEKKR